MAEPTMQEPGAGRVTEILGHLAALASAKFAYIKARLQLAGIEGKDAAVHYGIMAALAVAALVMVLFGYFFLVFALIFLIAWALDTESAWMCVTLGAGVLHLALAAGLVFAAKAKLSTPMFAATLDEFRKDREWLTTLAKPN